jgi:hypothetical protein
MSPVRGDRISALIVEISPAWRAPTRNVDRTVVVRPHGGLLREMLIARWWFARMAGSLYVGSLLCLAIKEDGRR